MVLKITENETFVAQNADEEKFICQNPECMAEVPEKSKVCPNCGKKITHIAIPDEGFVYDIDNNEMIEFDDLHCEFCDNSGICKVDAENNIHLAICADPKFNLKNGTTKSPLKITLEIYSIDLINKAIEDGLVVSVC